MLEHLKHLSLVKAGRQKHWPVLLSHCCVRTPTGLHSQAETEQFKYSNCCLFKMASTRFCCQHGMNVKLFLLVEEVKLINQKMESTVAQMTLDKKESQWRIVGGARGTRPPSPKFLHFHAVFGENRPNNRLAPPVWEILDPPLKAILTHASSLWISPEIDFTLQQVVTRSSAIFGSTLALSCMLQ